MDRRSYLISVFDDTMQRISDDAELLFKQKKSIAGQRLIREADQVDAPVAAMNHAETVILGAFCNDPQVVARAYNSVLRDYMRHFRTIEFAVYCRPGDDSNYRAFKSVMGSMRI